MEIWPIDLHIHGHLFKMECPNNENTDLRVQYLYIMYIYVIIQMYFYLNIRRSLTQWSNGRYFKFVVCPSKFDTTARTII